MSDASEVAIESCPRRGMRMRTATRKGCAGRGSTSVLAWLRCTWRPPETQSPATAFAGEGVYGEDQTKLRGFPQVEVVAHR